MFAEIAERDATGETAQLYADIRIALQVPIVNLIYRHIATIPQCLPWAWNVLRPLYYAPTMAAVTSRVLAAAASCRSPWGPLLDGSSQALGEARAIAQFYNSGNAANLVALLALRTALDRGIPRAAAIATVYEVLAPPPTLRRMNNINELDPGLAKDIRRVASAQDSYGLGVIPSMYLHLGHLRSITEQVVGGVESALGDGSLRQDADNVREAAQRAADELAPTLVAWQEAPAPDGLRQLDIALEAFTQHTIPAMLVVGTQVVKTSMANLDGPTLDVQQLLEANRLVD